MWVIELPIAARTGRARSTSPSVPPTMIVSVPFWAPSDPPDTGASTSPTPCVPRRSANSRVAAGEIVEQSMTRLPGCRPLGDAPIPEQDLGDVRRVRDADDDDVRLRGQRAGVGRLDGSERERELATAGSAVPDPQRESGSAQVRGHRRAHRAHAAEAHPLGGTARHDRSRRGRGGHGVRDFRALESDQRLLPKMRSMNRNRLTKSR